MDITPEVVTSFRSTYPEFSTPTKWSDTVITRALCEGDAETAGKGWGGYVDECHNFKQRGMFLFTAHWLVSTYQSVGDVDPTNVDYSARLNLSGKSVGDESVQFRITAIQATGDDWLSTTIYGTQFLRLRPRAVMGRVARAV